MLASHDGSDLVVEITECAELPTASLAHRIVRAVAFQRGSLPGVPEAGPQRRLVWGGTTARSNATLARFETIDAYGDVGEERRALPRRSLHAVI